MKHYEPGDDACFVVSQSPTIEKGASDRAAWCDDTWCYVDPCQCAITSTESFRFGTFEVSPGVQSGAFYSYATCGVESSSWSQDDQVQDAGGEQAGICGSPGGDSGATGLSLGPFVAVLLFAMTGRNILRR